MPEWLAISATVSALCLTAVWVVYPFLMRVAARLRQAGIASRSASRPAVTIVIATRADPADVRLKVLSCLDTDYPQDRVELVVAWDVNTWDHVPELGIADSRVRSVLGDAPGGKAVTLNAAVRSATHGLLIFTDTHQHFTRHTIPELAESMGDERLGAVSGALDLGQASRGTLIGSYWNYERALRRAEASVHSSIGVSGSIYAMRRELWQPLPARLLLDDLYIPLRLVMEGSRIGFNSNAVAIETRSTCPAQEYRRKVRTLAGILQVCVWLPGVMNPLRNPVWLAFVFHKVLRLLTPLCVFMIGLSGASLVPVVVRADLGMPILVVALSALAALVLIPSRAARRAREAIAWMLAMHAALIVGAMKGAQRQWNLWD